MGSPARPIFQRSRRRSPRQEELATTTIREFDGGWNVIDNDLNLSSKFAKTFDNVFRASDGSVQVRWGTRFIGRVDVQAASTGNLDATPLTTTASSAVVKVKHTAHGLISGHTVTLAGLTAFDGIPANELNALHTVSIVDVDNYNVTVTTTATAGATNGGGSSGTYSHNNKQLTGTIVNMIYFQDRFVIVDTNGELVEMDSVGVTRVVWNAAIAAKVGIGSPSGWSAMTFASFAVFGGKLLVCNGIDKPLIIDFKLVAPTSPCQYLQDIGSGSNLFTPTARYVLAMDHYVLMSGDPAKPGTIHVSNFDTSGTWAGDPAPNDGTTVDISKVVTSQNFTIRGLARFRDNVVVMIDDNFVVGKIGLFDSAGNHVPDFSDVIEQHGSISHRSAQNLGNDLLAADLIGVPSMKRAQFTGSIQPQRVSELIDPEIQKMLAALTVGSSEDHVFSVYNQLEGQYMLFVPNDTVRANATETTCFVYTVIASLKVKAWSRFKGWNWRCAARSALNRIFFADPTKVYVYGAGNDVIYSDFESDPDITIAGSGISFSWELPWADFDRRMSIKQSRYLSMDTRGTGRFVIRMFTDNKPQTLLGSHLSVSENAVLPDNPIETIGSDLVWTNPSNAKLVDGSVATVSTAINTPAGTLTNYLVGNFSSFAIDAVGPPPHEIIGIQVDIVCAGLNMDIEVQLGIISSSVFVPFGNFKSAKLGGITSGNLATYTFGGPGDLWGMQLNKAPNGSTPVSSSWQIFMSNTLVFAVRGKVLTKTPINSLISVDAFINAKVFGHTAGAAAGGVDPIISGANTGAFIAGSSTGTIIQGAVDGIYQSPPIIASDERLIPWHNKFKIAKLVALGVVKEEMKFISISLGYQDGSIRR